jgi:PKD repeat protein
MPTLNATVFPNEAYVLVEVDWTSDPSVQYANVTRRNTVTGEIVTLRPYIAYDDSGNLLLDCGLGIWWDTEPPLDVPLEYCTVAADVPTLLSENPFFESVATPWTGTNGATVARDCTVAHTGSCSLRLTPDGTTANPTATETVVMTITAGVPVTMSGWVMSSAGWNAVLLQLTVTYTDGKTETISSPIEILDDGEWRYLSVTFTPRLDVVGSSTLRMQIYGVPAGANLFYVDEIQVTSDQAITATACETVTVTGNGNFWLKSPLHPCDDILVGICNPTVDDCEEDSRVSFAGLTGNDYAPNTVLMQPSNRRRAIPSNRVRRDAESTLRLIAHDCDARDAVLAANEPGDELLWQAPATYCTPDRYISVGVESESYISVDQREDFRLMSLPHVVVDRPVGPADGPCGLRIVDLCDIYTSWGALNIAGLDWADLLLGEASHNAPGNDLPAGARIWGQVETEFATWLAVEAGGTRDWGELRDGL